jgi:Ni/Co efflux regulator RcnB
MRLTTLRAKAAWPACTLALMASVLSATAADAVVYAHRDVRTPRVSHHSTTVAGPRGAVHTSHTTVNRSRAGWWHGQPGFNGYHGARRGYYYAPGHGYYHSHGFSSAYWRVGGVFPASARRYVVVSPSYYGLAVAPAGHRWYYSGPNLVLVAIATGVIVKSVAGGW